jgi:hypothetical protein
MWNYRVIMREIFDAVSARFGVRFPGLRFEDYFPMV